MSTSPNTLDDLRSRITRGETFDYLLFWGHRVRADGVLTAACFSQWYPARFEIDGVVYPTAEHFMMAEKARLFDDQAALAKVLVAETPNDAKALGRRVKGYDDARWVAHRFDAVVTGNRAKFSQSKALRAFLAGTAPRVIVEASPVDAIWGIGMATSDPRAADPLQWQGLNLLGFALMVVRDALARGAD
jgi:ribA/ribD-fused uncharacterized protein